MEIFILIGLIILNGLFTMSEIALVSVRKARLEGMAERGDKKAEAALKLSNSPELFLSAAQIGITLISILTGVYSGEKFSKDLQPAIAQIKVLEPYSQGISTTIIVILVTFLSIVFGAFKRPWSANLVLTTPGSFPVQYHILEKPGVQLGEPHKYADPRYITRRTLTF